MEVCVDSVESAVNAEKGGAARLELCADLSSGGTTPSMGLFLQVKQHVAIPIFVMIRPRPGNFTYNDLEVKVMESDINAFIKAGADGVVFGCLTRDGTVDKHTCLTLEKAAQSVSTTFHRAFDVIPDQLEALEDVIELGFERILTSGGVTTAVKGIDKISELQRRAQGRIIIMPGSGVKSSNAETILDRTNCCEIHGSASVAISTAGVNYELGDIVAPSTHNVTNVDEVRTIVNMLKSHLEKNVCQ